MNRLEPEDDERAVVTLATAASRDGWELRYGSVLVGPPSFAARSGPEWHDHDRHPAEVLPDPAIAGVGVAAWRTFDQVVGDGWRVVRFTTSVADACDRLDDMVSSGRFQVPEGGPVIADLRAPQSLVTVHRHVDTPLSRLVVAAWRPVTGWFHAAMTPTGTPPPEWSPAPSSWFVASLQLLGLAANAPEGLLVGRLHRDVWIAGVRGRRGDPDLEFLDVWLRLDPDRISLWEIVVELEETDREGELLGSRRVRLADLELPPHGADRVTVQLPTVGRGAVRRIRLSDLGGRLLDAMDDVRLVEQIDIAVGVAGAPPATTGSVGDASPPSLAQRLTARDRTESEFRRLLEAGRPGRIIAPGSDGRAALRERLTAARGELRVFDPYFGRDAIDWDLLDGVTVPIRVLTGQKVTPPSRPAPAPRLRCRRWRTRPPVHDRGYLWDGGGVSVGTSANGLGHRASVIDAMEPSIAEGWCRSFESWWTGPDVEPR